eukprot:Gb_13369 [translate_table: standard]
MRRETMKKSNYLFTNFLRAVIPAEHTSYRLSRIYVLQGIQLCSQNLMEMFVEFQRTDISTAAFQARRGRKPKDEDRSVKLSFKETVGSLCKERRLEEAVEGLHLMRQGCICADSNTYSRLLHACIKTKALAEGKRIHAHMVDTGFKLDTLLANLLMEMFIKCGSVVDARQLFDQLPLRDVFSWNIMISGYAKCGSMDISRQLFEKMPQQSEVSWKAVITGYCRQGDCREALKLFWQMQHSGTKSTEFTLASVLNACASLTDLEQGKQVHAHILRDRFELNFFVWNALVDMYAKCGSLESARRTFDKMLERDVVSWNAIISGYARHGIGPETLKLFCQMSQTGVKPNQFTYASVLTACASLPALKQGKQIHGYIIRTGFELNVFTGSALVDMYAKCGSIEYARRVFDKMPEQDTVSWTGMISGYAQNGLGDEALKLFSQMQQVCIKPDQVTFASVLSACVSSGSVKDARQLFDKMPERNVVSWNAMIAVYSQSEHGGEALTLFLQMQRAGMKPTQSTFASILGVCASLPAFKQGNQVHAKVIKAGLESNVFVGSALLNMYAKCGSIDDAWQLFDILPERNAVSWNAMIAGYTQNDYGEEALKLFCKMQQAGIGPDQVTYASVLRACASLASLEQGKQVHAVIIRVGIQSNVFVRNALVDVYAKCGSIEEACQQFERIPDRDVVSWNAMIVGYAQNGQGEEALKLFYQMLQADIKPDQVTFASVFNACASLAVLDHGKKVHNYIIKNGFELNAFVGSALIDMYAKCGSMKDADKVLSEMPEPNVVSWNAMITGYVQNSNGNDALNMFCNMQQTGMMATQFTFASVLVACGSLPALEQGKQVHGQIVKTGFQSNVFVGSALVDMYARCESIGDASRLFYEMPEHNVVSWTTMIAGYAQNGHSEEVLKLFWQMKGTDVHPDHATFASILRACANLAALQHGRQVHGHIIQSAFLSNVYAGGALIDMYAKCGSIEDARQVFNEMPERDIVSWNAMIAGYAQNGCGKNALQLFEQMLLSSMKPDYITFIGILSACSHAGLVDEGRHFFESMIQDYCIKPTADHYACMIDLLGRAGQLAEAEDIIKNMACEPDAIMWGTLLAACRIHGNRDLGKRAAECLIKLEPQNSAPYVMLSNIYAAAGRWDDVTMVRKLMKDMGVKKKPACSWIEVKNRVHAFMVDDKSHPQTEEIYAMLERLTGQMKEAGYVADTNFVPHGVEAE